MKKDLKAEYWLKCWMAVASSSNVTDPKRCSEWADRMLHEFDKRFPEYNDADNKKVEPTAIPSGGAHV